MSEAREEIIIAMNSDYLTSGQAVELLDQVEDDRVHAEVHRILDIHYETVLTHGAKVGQGLGLAIKTIDPYVLKDGQLVRKSDGKLMHCEKCP